MQTKELQIGEKVKLTTLKEQVEGTILESPDSNIILLKLNSGYNIGIKKDDIRDIMILEYAKEKKEEKMKLKSNPSLPFVDIIITGGTISSRLDYKTGAVKWLTSPEQLLKFYPEIFSLVNIRKIKIPFMKASENMDFKDWQEIAKSAEESLNDMKVSGVIITHGTDFLHYTGAALSFFLRDLNKPVVLTYSQRSSDRASSDARLNLQCSALVACSDIAEVVLVGHSSMNDDFCYALKAVKSRKMHSSRRDAFKSINAKPIAKVWPEKIEILSSFNSRDNNKKVKLDSSFNEKVALIKFYPGQDPEILDYYSQKAQGIVIEASGLGHLASEFKSWISKIKKAIDNGLIICIATQTISGRVDPYVYSPGRELLKAGAIFLEDMLPEVALVKLGWVLSHKQWRAQIKEKMLENFAGELNPRLEE